MTNELSTYRTQNGHLLHLRPVRAVLLQRIAQDTESEWREKGEKIDPPMYLSEFGGGESMNVPLTKNSLDIPNDERRTQLNHLLWERYQEALERMNSAIREAQLIAMFMLGVSVEGGVPEDGWEQTLALVGVTVPTDPPARRMAYWLFYSELNESEVAELQGLIMSQMFGGAVDPKDVEGFRSNIRDTMVGAARDFFTSLGVGRTGAGVVHDDTLPGASDGAEVGPERETVGTA